MYIRYFQWDVWIVFGAMAYNFRILFVFKSKWKRTSISQKQPTTPLNLIKITYYDKNQLLTYSPIEPTPSKKIKILQKIYLFKTTIKTKKLNQESASIKYTFIYIDHLGYRIKESQWIVQWASLES